MSQVYVQRVLSNIRDALVSTGERKLKVRPSIDSTTITWTANLPYPG